MRIKLTANSNVTLPAHLSDIDLSYGYTLENNLSNDWKLKLAAGIDKTLSFFKPLSAEQKDFIKSVTESAKFLDSHIPASESHLDNFKIQLNIASPLNKGMRMVSDIVWELYKGVNKASFYLDKPLLSQKLKDNIFNTFTKLHFITNPYLGQINFDSKIMYLGSEIFKNNSDANVTSYVQENLGMKKFVNFLVFHEASHSFEFTNTAKFGDKFDPLFRQIYDNTENITHNKSLRNDLNILIKDNENLGLNTVSGSYSVEISTLYKEIYADIGSILLQRNQDILEGKHSRENDLLNINTIIESRNREQQHKDNNCMSSNYPDAFEHFTSPGLEYLRDNCYQLPNKVLSQEKIHTIAQKAIEQGISRMLIASSVANKNNIEDLKVLFSVQLQTYPDQSKEFLVPSQINPNVYIDTMNELKKYAGEDWVKQFTDNLHLIHEKNVDDKKKATWHAAFFPNKFKQDLENSSSLKDQMAEIFGTKTEQKPDLSREDVGAKVNSLLDKFRRTDSNNNKPKIQ